LKERTMTTGGIVHHFGNLPSGLRKAGHLSQPTCRSSMTST
jgi:hypothetical protein